MLCIPVKGRSNCRKKRTLWHHQWRRPLPLRLTFWKKPIGDRETFKLMLFCLGNGCSPPLISTWILLSQTWAPDKAEKRAWQLDYVLNNPEAERNMVLLCPRPQQTFVFKWIPKQQSQHQQDAAEKPRKSKKNHKRRKNPALQDTKKGSLRSHQNNKSL